MFSEVELVRDVAVIAENLDRNGLVSQQSIILCLLKDLSSEKASKKHGYFLAITCLKSIGKVKVADESGNMFVPVVFNCRTFLPLRGEVLQGVVYRISRLGVFLRCGPVECAFLSARKMPNYHYVYGEIPLFLSEDLTRMEVDVVVQFVVLDVRCIKEIGDMRTEFKMLASIEDK